MSNYKESFKKARKTRQETLKTAHSPANPGWAV
jgi:hypothetical protein